MELTELVDSISNFAAWSHADKIRLFAWYQHSQAGKQRFSSTDISGCYQRLSIPKASNISQFLSEMVGRKQAMKDKSGYHLSRSCRDKLEAKYGQRPMTVHITKMLGDLPMKVPNVDEREFLKETLTCYKCGAFRATIVMCWSLAFDHFLHYILKHHLTKFNTQWPVTFAKHHDKSRVSTISTRDDFGEFQDTQILQICKAAAIITPDIYKIMDENLGKRNTAAHPSNVTIGQSKAESVVEDLVTNIVLKLPL
jgi:hypothetical protein